MAERLDISRLQSEWLLPEFAALALAFLEMNEEDLRRVSAYRERGVQHMSLLGWTVMLHVFVVDVAHRRGTRAQVLVESLPVPRRTIRDNLRHLVEEGALMQDDRGLYNPTTLAAELAGKSIDLRLRQIRRIHDAWEAFEAARRR